MTGRHKYAQTNEIHVYINIKLGSMVPRFSEARSRKHYRKENLQLESWTFAPSKSCVGLPSDPGRLFEALGY